MVHFISTLIALAAVVDALDVLSEPQIPLNQENIAIRPAVEADLDDIVTIMIEAFLPGPTWQYIYTNGQKYKEFWWHCLREDIGRQYSHRPNNSWVNVISKPSNNWATTTDDGKISRVVAFAMWGLLAPLSSDAQKSTLSAMGGPAASLARCSDHPELNSTRAVDFGRQAQDMENRYIHNYPDEQLYLAFLATHPSWDGHGFGAAHLRWGLGHARRKGQRVPVTLLSTPAGWPLYDSMGFNSVKNITITTLDDDIADLWFEYMRFDKSGDELR